MNIASNLRLIVQLFVAQVFAVVAAYGVYCVLTLALVQMAPNQRFAATGAAMLIAIVIISD